MENIEVALANSPLRFPELNPDGEAGSVMNFCDKDICIVVCTSSCINACFDSCTTFCTACYTGCTTCFTTSGQSGG